jgi:hypothetical protein
MNAIRLSPAQHVFSFAGAVAIAATLFLGAAAEAQTQAPGHTYRAELAQPVAQQQVIAGGVLWRCEGTTCTAQRSNSRPAIVCARLARETGQMVRFMTSGEALPAEQLSRCNAVAGN